MKKIALTLAAFLAFATFKPAVAAPPTKDRDLQIQKWVQELDADSYRARREAARNLRLAGKEAFPALIEATKKGGPEVMNRAIHIIKEHFDVPENKELKSGGLFLEVPQPDQRIP